MPLVRQLLALYEAGEISDDELGPWQLGPLPGHAPKKAQLIAEQIDVYIRLLLTEGVARALPYATSEPVKAVAAHGPVSKNGVRGGVKGRGVSIDAALPGLARDGRAQEVHGLWEACPAAPAGRDVPDEGHEPAASVQPPRADSSRALPDEAPPGPLVSLVAEPTAPAPAPSAYDPFGEFA